jgi:hypothetical protein
MYKGYIKRIHSILYSSHWQEEYSIRLEQMKLYHIVRNEGRGNEEVFCPGILLLHARETEGGGIMQHYLWSYIGIAISVFALAAATFWWVYSKYKRRAR